MTRVGWFVLGAIALAAALFASMVRFGGATPGPAARPTVAGPIAPAPARDDDLPPLAVPVAGVRRDRIADTWGQARSEGRVHHGVDIMAPGGTPVLAAADGTIEKLYESRLGGTTLYERSVDRRWTFYYAHLSGYAPGLHEGQAVRAGEPIAFVGDTGDAGPGNYHLHFSLARLTPDQHWWQAQDVNAWPALRGR